MIEESLKSSIDQLRIIWRKSLFIKEGEEISKIDQRRLALTEMMSGYTHDDNYALYHLTLTYKPYSDQSYGESDINSFYKSFYTKYFLPYLFMSRNYNRSNNRYKQPICFSFIDEHGHKPNDRKIFSDRLHTHSIIAVHPDHINRINDLVGTDTIPTDREYTNKIMTSNLKPCSSDRLLYASKMMKKYPDFLSFPDRLNQQIV